LIEERDIDTDLYFFGIDPFVELSYHTLELLLEGQVIPNDYPDLYPNQRYILKSEHGNSICVKITSDNMIHKYDLPAKYGEIEGCDLNQKIALDMMHDNDIQLVSCLAPAGCGKTFIALATVLRKLIRKEIHKVYFIKPLIGVSKSKFLGTLPGGVDEKVAPFLESFYDVAYSLGHVHQLERLFSDGKIEFIPVDFIRGRNLDNCYLVVDEVQNLDHHDLLSVLTRLGKRSRAFLLGDPNPEQNDIRHGSGLVELISDYRFWESGYTSCIHLKKRMRSPIVELAEAILLR
jgi:predicted ribonuclease YlaK